MNKAILKSPDRWNCRELSVRAPNKQTLGFTRECKMLNYSKFKQHLTYVLENAFSETFWNFNIDHSRFERLSKREASIARSTAIVCSRNTIQKAESFLKWNGKLANFSRQLKMNGYWWSKDQLQEVHSHIQTKRSSLISLWEASVAFISLWLSNAHAWTNSFHWSKAWLFHIIVVRVVYSAVDIKTNFFKDQESWAHRQASILRVSVCWICWSKYQLRSTPSILTIFMQSFSTKLVETQDLKASCWFRSWNWSEVGTLITFHGQSAAFIINW